MAWKLGVAVFLAAALVMILGPMLIYIVGTLIAITIAVLLLTLTAVSLFSPRRPRRDGKASVNAASELHQSPAVRTTSPDVLSD